MSDEKIEARETESDDVEAHEYVRDESANDPERKHQPDQYEEPVDPDGGDFGRRGT